MLLSACSSTPPVDPTVGVYCSAVKAEAEAMDGDASVKRPAMARLRDVAPAEIRDDWDVVFELSVQDPSVRDLAADRVAEFEADHCV